MARKYPRKSGREILHDLVRTTPGEEGKWFAAAKQESLYDEALALARASACDPRTLTRAARDLATKAPPFAVDAGLLALHWLATGVGYEVTASDVLTAYSSTIAAAEKNGNVPRARANPADHFGRRPRRIRPRHSANVGRCVIQRAFIHVAGPNGCGKTTFLETLPTPAGDPPIVAGRCTRDDRVRRMRESSPRVIPNSSGIGGAGAWAAAVFTFSRDNANLVEFYESRLMLEYSQAVIVEGDNTAGYADLEVFVAPAPLPGETLYVRRQRHVAAVQRAQAEAWEESLRGPDGMATWIEDVMGLPLRDFARSNPRLTEDIRCMMLERIAQVRAAGPPRPVDHRAVCERFQGIERAGLVVVNLRDRGERSAAEQLRVGLERLRKDDALFNDIIGWRRHRLPITAVVANFADPRDAGRKKAIARVRRTALAAPASSPAVMKSCVSAVAGSHTGVRM